MAEFTKYQSNVINAKIDNILVSAAAGSGKTTVLVERIIRKIMAGELSLDGVLVVTFTKAAASNMQSKIDSALRNAIKENSNNQELVNRLKRQLEILPNAYIQTLNSFCSRVIKDKGYELAATENAIDPSMTILGDQELKILLRKAAQEALDNKYESIVLNGEDESFNKAINYFSDGRSDIALVDQLVSIYPKLRSLPNYISKIEKSVEDRRKNDEAGIVSFLPEFNEKFLTLFREANSSSKKSLDIVDGVVFLKKKNDERIDSLKIVLNSIVEITDGVLAYSEGDNTQEMIFCEIKNAMTKLGVLEKPGIGGSDLSVGEFWNVFGGAAAILLQAMTEGRAPNFYGTLASPYLLDGKYKGFINSSVEEFLESQKSRTEIIAAFVELLKGTDINYKKLKKRFHAMDFSDQEQFALQVLTEPSVREYYKEKFTEIYVDEYQDNSTLQDAVIKMFSKKNVFMVGDVKQSIYKFRYANPSMFINKMETYEEDVEESKEGSLYKLNNNFRSTPEILDFVNAIFEQLMSKTTEIEYDESHKLYPAPNAERNNALPRVIVVNDVNNESGSDSEDEDSSKDSSSDIVDEADVAKWAKIEFKGVYNEVKHYLDLGYEKKDICILTRKTEAARHFASLLNDCGILAICPEKKPIYNDSDIATLYSFLTLLGNEHRDECLLGLLLAGYRFSNFTVDELAKITSYAKKNNLLYMNLIVKIRKFASQEDVSEEDKELVDRTRNFLNVFDEIRSDSSILNIGELIEKIYAETGIKSTLESKGEDTGKLIVFKNWLCENYMSRGSDIGSIAASLEELKLQLGDKAAIEYETTAVDAIPCMTYHKSKGLEYKCVIVSDFSSKEVTDNDKTILFDENMGFLCNDFTESTLTRDTSFERIMFEDYARLSDLSEVIRLFYVAFTRAEKHLSIVTSTKPRDKKDYQVLYRKIVSQKKQKFDKEYILKTKNRNELLLSAFLRMKASDSYFYMVRDGAEIPVPVDDMYKSDFDGFEFMMIDYDEIVAEKVLNAIDEKPKYEECLAKIDENGRPYFDEYRYEPSVMAPSKTTVSELKKLEQKLLYDKEEDSNVVDDSSKTSIAINLVVPELDFFDNETAYDSSSSKGTLIHNLLRYMDFSSMLDKLDSNVSADQIILEEVGYLKDNGVVTEKMIPVINEFIGSLKSFVESDLFRRIAVAEKSSDAEFEKPIMFTTNVEGTPDNTIVQGIIDVLFYENSEAVIVDYKTDRIKANSISEIENIVKDRHSLQLDLYSAALEAAGIKVKSKIIWLIRNGISIEI